MLRRAEEVREEINKINTSEEASQLKEVEDKIEKDKKKGCTYYYGKLKESVASKLYEFGYKIEYSSDQRDGEITTIKW